MEIEDILQLLINKTGKTRNEILNLIEKKQLEAGGTISDGAAATLVSKDLGLKLTEITDQQPTKIADLLHMAPGSSNITISGTVKRIYAPNQFSQEDKNKIVQNLVLIDSSDSIRVVIWGSAVELIKNLRILKGDQIRLIKGYLKNGRMGEREIHLNDSSIVEKIQLNEREDSIDVWSDVLLPSAISKDHSKLREIDIQGIVINTFNTQESERPATIFLISPDDLDSYQLKVNFWRERKKEVGELKIGEKILIEGVTVKEGLQNTIEANFNRSSNISILEHPPNPNKYEKLIKNFNLQKGKYPDIQNKDLGSIQLGENFNLTVKITWIGKIGSFSKKDGVQGNFIRLGIYDNTGSNVIVLWDENAKNVEKFNQKDVVTIKNAYLRENKGNLEISLSKNGSIEKANLNSDSIPESVPYITIQSLTKNWKIASVWGNIISKNDLRTFKRNDGSEGKVRSLLIADNTGDMRLVAWNTNIDMIEQLEPGMIISAENLNIRINNYNNFDGHLTDYSIITIQSDPLKFPDWIKDFNYNKRKNSYQQSNKYKRIYINQLTDSYKEEILNESDYGNDFSNIDNFIEFKANIVEIFENPLFYQSCPNCSKKVEMLSEDSATCPNHNIVVPVPRLLIRIVFDDGLNNVVSTLIGSAAERITSFSPEKLKKFLEENNNEKGILLRELKELLLGNEYLIRGKLEIRKAYSQENEYNWDIKINYISEANAINELGLLES